MSTECFKLSYPIQQRTNLDLIAQRIKIETKNLPIPTRDTGKLAQIHFGYAELAAWLNQATLDLAQTRDVFSKITLFGETLRFAGGPERLQGSYGSPMEFFRMEHDGPESTED